MSGSVIWRRVHGRRAKIRWRGDYKRAREKRAALFSTRTRHSTGINLSAQPGAPVGPRLRCHSRRFVSAAPPASPPVTPRGTEV
ncbi:unnamed protein product, partial [Iphiclides podalirius]